MDGPADARTRRSDTETKISGANLFRRRAIEQTDEWTNDLEREIRSGGRTDENVNELRCRKTKKKVIETNLFRRLPNPRTSDGRSSRETDDVKKRILKQFVLAAPPNLKNQEIPNPDLSPLNPNSPRNLPLQTLDPSPPNSKHHNPLPNPKF